MVGKILLVGAAIAVFFVWACIVAFCCTMLINSDKVEQEIEEEKKDDCGED